MSIPEGQQVLMRIYVSESDKHNGKTMYHEIMELLRKEKMAGATVLRGIAGFGAKSHIHSASLLSLSKGLPIVIEVVDTPEQIEQVEPRIREIVADGLITLQKVHVRH